MPTTYPDRSHEKPAEACPMHTVRAVLIVTAEAPEGTTAEHLAMYAASFFGGERADKLHEDIFDELDAAANVGAVRAVENSVLDAAISAACDVMNADASETVEALRRAGRGGRQGHPLEDEEDEEVAS